MRFAPEFFEEEIREGFTVTPMVKRAWAVCIEVLSEIDRICKKFDIKYFAYYGTLLGAVRHSGFVPWDDDVDIMMLREDYERFFEVAPGELQYGFKARGHVAAEYDYGAMSSVVSREYLDPSEVHAAGEEEILSDPQHGCPYVMGVDIYAFDYLPDDPEFWNTQRMLHMAAYDAAYRYEELAKSGEIEELAGQLSSLTGIELDPGKPMQPQLFLMADRIASMATESESSTVVWMQTTAKSDRFNNIDKHKFDTAKYIKFENIEVPAPADSEEILTVLFGDFRKFVRFTSGHKYPVFKMQDEWLGRQIKPAVTIGVTGSAGELGEAENGKLRDNGIKLCFPDGEDNESGFSEDVDAFFDGSEYKDAAEFEEAVLKLAIKIRGREIDKRIGFKEHDSFYYTDELK